MTVQNHDNKPKAHISSDSDEADFKFLLEQFADIKILRYKIPGFEGLTLKQKLLIYYLSQATLCGRDIIFDQNGKYNLAIRRTLENIYHSYNGSRQTSEWQYFIVYLKRVWFSNGIYHHYASDKFIPEFSVDYFKELAFSSDATKFPVRKTQSVEKLIEELIPVMFDEKKLPKKVSLDATSDLLLSSAVNFYSDVKESEVEKFYQEMIQPDPERPLSFGLNTSLYKKDGEVFEETWKLDGKYSKAIEQIIYWIGKACQVAETQQQKDILLKLIEYYKTGDLKTWDEYNVLWLKDVESEIDFVNGFIETYQDPLGRKGTWESLVNFKNKEATLRAEAISRNAQWFEDNSPVDSRFKKAQVQGVTAKVITVAQLGGDCYPSTPIGINLPNADWIRKEHGSKSVTIENITYAYEQAALGNGMLEEFVLDEKDRELSRLYGSLAGNVHTDLHECLGHGSGQLLPGTGTEALRNYYSTLEEARADLFALYFIADQKMLELKIFPSVDVAKAEYNAFIRNGLITQLTRIAPGKNLEESHMRNRQLISKWCYEKGLAENVIEYVYRDEKTYVRINDYTKLRNLFGVLLAEIQRIKSEGDYEAGKMLVETYGVKVDPELHSEILMRFKKLNLAPYSGFLNPEINLITENGKVTDVKVDYPHDFSSQMIHYSRSFSFLDTWND